MRGTLPRGDGLRTLLASWLDRSLVFDRDGTYETVDARIDTGTPGSDLSGGGGIAGGSVTVYLPYNADVVKGDVFRDSTTGNQYRVVAVTRPTDAFGVIVGTFAVCEVEAS